MQYKIIDESPWQILSNAMTIGPSSTGYQLQVAADGRNYTTLFTVGAGITRQITNLSSGSYFRMKGNVGEVTVNWVRDCSGGGGGTTYTAGEYISIDQDIISVTGITPDLYLTTADTQDFVTADALSGYTSEQDFQDFQDAISVKEEVIASAITELHDSIPDVSDFVTTGDIQNFVTEADITAATSPIQEQVDDIERVTATALTELHQDILDLSGATPDLSNYYTSAQTDAAISAATANMVSSTSVSTIWRGTQAEYDAITTPDASTLYIIINN